MVKTVLQGFLVFESYFKGQDDLLGETKPAKLTLSFGEEKGSKGSITTVFTAVNIRQTFR